MPLRVNYAARDYTYEEGALEREASQLLLDPVRFNNK